MLRALLPLFLTACFADAGIEVVPEVATDDEPAAGALPSELTCGTAAPELAMIYVGGYVTLPTACQGHGKTTIVLLHDERAQWTASRDVMAELAPRYRVIAPSLRGSAVPIAHQLQDLVMLIRKTSPGPVLVAGGELARVLAAQHPELVLAVFDPANA